MNQACAGEDRKGAEIKQGDPQSYAGRPVGLMPKN